MKLCVAGRWAEPGEAGTLNLSLGAAAGAGDTCAHLVCKSLSASQPAPLPQPAGEPCSQGVGLEVGDMGHGGRASLVPELELGAFAALFQLALALTATSAPHRQPEA